MRIIGLTMGALLIATACSGGSLDGTWHVEGMLQSDGTMSTPDPVVVLTLIIDGNTITGNSGCNTFTGEGSWPGEEWNFAATARACVDNSLNEQENVYLVNLLATEEAEIVGDTMTARDADGEVILVFARTPG